MYVVAAQALAVPSNRKPSAVAKIFACVLVALNESATFYETLHATAMRCLDKENQGEKMFHVNMLATT